MPTLLYEIEHGRNIGKIIAGTDEAGRGPLAGPVVAAAIIIPQHFPERLAKAINDSKQLSEKKREVIFPQLLEHCIHGIAECSAQEIDSINILQASLLAMKRAVSLLSTQPHVVLVDGNKSPNIPNMKNIPIIKGDSKSLSIAAASILAKVTRDRLMQSLHNEFPHYGWAHNAGYPTQEHITALAAHGITRYHRQSFGPVKKYCTTQYGVGE
ncbi:MAG: ribonuclease HII [Alphaproteobacteria bacterium]|nr:ribonuclease HII [Alphaproteobacteria bacterium]